MDFATERSADGGPPGPFASTMMETDEELFAGFWSITVLDSDATAMFVIIVPAVPTFTIALMLSVEVVFEDIVPTDHTPELATYVPADVVAEMKVKPGGRLSCTVAPVEVAGPDAETVTV
jgi:hypothetical protein